MSFVAGGTYEGWGGSLLVGSLRDKALLRLELAEGQVIREERLIEDLIGRIRDVRLGPDGFIYLVNDEIEGGLYRLAPAMEQASRPPPVRERQRRG